MTSTFTNTVMNLFQSQRKDHCRYCTHWRRQPRQLLVVSWYGYQLKTTHTQITSKLMRPLSNTKHCLS